MNLNAIAIDPADNVATALTDVAQGEAVVCDGGRELAARELIPTGHKVALVAIAEGEIIRKYGHPIGVAARPIAAGEYVHTHNLAAAES
jgi:altronate dehydratase